MPYRNKTDKKCSLVWGHKTREGTRHKGTGHKGQTSCYPVLRCFLSERTETQCFLSERTGTQEVFLSLRIQDQIRNIVIYSS